jgi:hypothetical protein
LALWLCHPIAHNLTGAAIPSMEAGRRNEAGAAVVGELRPGLEADAIALEHGTRVTEVAYSFDERL